MREARPEAEKVATSTKTDTFISAYISEQSRNVDWGLYGEATSRRLASCNALRRPADAVGGSQ
jgi:hypothetical protein